MNIYKSPFKMADRVYIDCDKSMTAIVTGVLWRDTYHQVEVGWLANCTPHSEWIDECRLELAPVEREK